MSTRAVSAGRWLTPLAILIPIAATPIVAVWVLTLDTGPGGAGLLLGLLVLGSGLAAVALAGRLTLGLRSAVVTAILTWLVAIVAEPFWFALSINTSVCGKDVAGAWEWLPPTGGALTFLAVGSWGLRARHSFTVVPLAGLLGPLVLFGLLALVPGTQGVCET
ncbi:MAG TPA: hypothetical protein VFU64_02095 [Gaiellaceae bacterium]|nr:hypothetical protein [Gaiellaceae bacterium]